jgi:hypothetical protein
VRERQERRGVGPDRGSARRRALQPLVGKALECADHARDVMGFLRIEFDRITQTDHHRGRRLDEQDTAVGRDRTIDAPKVQRDARSLRSRAALRRRTVKDGIEIPHERTSFINQVLAPDC